MRTHAWKVSAHGLGALVVLAALATGCASSKDSTDHSPARSTGRYSTLPTGSELNAQDIERSGETSVEEILEGRVSGVDVIRLPSGGYQLRIRGASTFSGSNEPLIVVDGKALPDGYGGSIPVNPHDIATIRVLKNAIDLAFYGMRGANGVIEITTKRGR